MYHLGPTWEEDIRELGCNMLPEVIAEVRASHNLSPVGALVHCINRSIETYTAAYDGQVLGIVGLVPGTILGQWASPWLLTSPEAKDHPIYFVRVSKRLLNRWLKIYPILENYVDARFDASLKWAKAVGFEIHDAQPFGYAGLPFHRISIRGV